MLRPKPMLAGAIAALCLGAMTGCGSTTPEPAHSAREAEQPALAAIPRGPVTVLAVGDSLAEGSPASGTPNDPGSWVHYLGDAVQVVGGWSQAGATSADVLADLPSDSADVLALLIGTNDAKQRFDLAGLPSRIESIVAAVDVQHVVISEIPPYRYDSETVGEVNEMIEELASEHGWTLVDAWADSRDGDQWAEGGSPDGTHGSDAAYRSAGRAFTEAIVRSASEDG